MVEPNPQTISALLGLHTEVSADSHPATANVNDAHVESLSKTEMLCRRIASWTSAPIALMGAIFIQLGWIALGAALEWDPFPFVFLLTCSNVLQLVLIFVIAVAQRQQSAHDELRAESDHTTINRLLYHQQVQELLLLRLAEKAGVSTEDVHPILATLSETK